MLYCIIGKSGSGKKTAMKYLREYAGAFEKRYGNITFEVLCEYTTRPPRTGEIDGDAYHFCTRKQFEQMRRAGEVSEWRILGSPYNPWYCFNRKVDLSDKKDYVVTTTPDGALSLIKAYGEDAVAVVYLEVEPWRRVKRCMEKEANPDYREIFRRFLSDEDEFYAEHPIWKDPHFYTVFNDYDGDIDVEWEAKEWLQRIREIVTQ